MTDPAPQATQFSGSQTLLILGASGDLTARLLLPGLGGLLANGGAPNLTLLGSGTHEWQDESWRQTVADSFATVKADGPDVERVARTARYLQADVTQEDDLRHLLEACEGRVVLYFALPPAITMKACVALAGIGVPEGTTLVLEKPFGTDANTAHELNQVLTRLAPEDHIHRVDHFLGMSTVLNIIGLRFANRIFEPLLNATHVEAVDIIFDEPLALEDRAGYYDGAGALTDMIQSHLLQVLSLIAMDAPPSMDATEFRDLKAQALRATRPWTDNPADCSRRARYAAGSIAGRDVPAYADEKGVDPARGTETLAEVVLAVDNWRWSGVPFRLRSGKALGAGRQEAVITFRQPPRVPDGLSGHERPNRLRIGFGPDRLALDVNINGPDDPFVLDPVTLETSFGQGLLPPYGEVLRAALNGDATLSVRGDTAERCWRIVEPIIAAWRAGDVPLQEYPAGSDGPGDSVIPRPPKAQGEETTAASA